MRFTLFILLLYPLLLFAQQHNFRRWTVEEGLPQSQVKQIIQDYKGQLWLGTRGGLSRFNGSTFYNYSKNDGLNSNNILSLFQDSKNRIWIGTDVAGVSAFEATTFKHYTAGLPKGGVKSIGEDKLGRILLATDSGVYYFDKGEISRLEALPAQPYTAILCTAAGELWAGSAENGLYKLTGKEIVHYTSANSKLPGNSLNCLLEDDQHTVWIGTEEGLAMAQPEGVSLFPLPSSVATASVQALSQDNYGHLWIALHNQGLLQFDGQKLNRIVSENGLSTNQIIAVAPDKEGSMWLGTAGHGLQQYHNPWFVHYGKTSRNGHRDKVTTLVKDEKGMLWVGTETGDLAYLKDEALQWLKQAWPENTILYSIQAIDENTLWACTSDGVWKVRPALTQLYSSSNGLPSNDVYHCLRSRAGETLFATSKGIAVKNGKRFLMPEVLGSPMGSANFIFEDSRGQIWVGAANGIYAYADGRLEEHAPFNEFDFKDVTTIAEDADGTLYFGGYNYGILAFNSSWQLPRLITADDGLPNEGVSSLYIDDADNLWIGTGKYASKLPLSQLGQSGKLTLQTYDNDDGFSGAEVSSNAISQSADGSIWFGTANGLTKFTPSRERRIKVQPVCQLQDIKLYMQDADWKSMGYELDSLTGLPENLRLPHHQNHLSFSFSSINLSEPGEASYRYRLKGYSDEWSVPTNQSFASFDSLSPGTYTFELIAQNSDGYWTTRPLSYTFSITPPIWKREWFIAVLVLIVGGTAFSVVRLREKSLVKRNTLLEMKVQHRTKLLEEKNFEKEILLKEIHHRVKNNLQIVISMLNLQARQVKDETTLDVTRALRNRVRSMALLHERLYQHDDLASIDLDAYFRGICESLYASYGITTEQVQLQLQMPTIKVDIDSAITLGLIVNELISNTLKYAFQGCSGTLRIELQQLENQNYILSVSDNGKGLPADFEECKLNSFGLQLVTSLAKKLNGTISFDGLNGTSSKLFFNLST